MLATDASVKQWSAENLPADDHSVQNGILTTQASRFPLCIDPQMQAVRWLKTRESKNNLVVRQLNDPDFMKQLELAVKFGNSFLFENVGEELDPMLDPILEKDTFKPTEVTRVREIYSRIMKVRLEPSSCASCFREIVFNLRKIYDAYTETTTEGAE